MRKLSIAICEDQDADRKRLEDAIALTGVPCVCEFFENGEEFLADFVHGKYDLVFLDVYMGGMTGVDVAQRVRNVDPDVMLSFVTTSADFTMEGYRNRVERYILKPYRDEDVREVVESAFRRASSSQERMLTVAGESIPFSRIRYAEQKNHTTIIYIANGAEVKRTGRFDDIAQQLPCPPFYRCHRSYLVNLDYVRLLNYDLNMFELEGGGCAYIRRGSVREAKRMFEDRLIERTRALGEA